MLLSELIVLGLASGTVSVTVAQSKAFAWFRDLLKDVAMFGELVKCSYCLGHYSSFCLVLLWYQDLTWTFGLVAWLAVTAISALTAGTIGLLFIGGKDVDH